MIMRVIFQVFYCGIHQIPPDSSHIFYTYIIISSTFTQNPLFSSSRLMYVHTPFSYPYNKSSSFFLYAIPLKPWASFWMSSRSQAVTRLFLALYPGFLAWNSSKRASSSGRKWRIRPWTGTEQRASEITSLECPKTKNVQRRENAIILCRTITFAHGISGKRKSQVRASELGFPKKGRTTKYEGLKGFSKTGLRSSLLYIASCVPAPATPLRPRGRRWCGPRSASSSPRGGRSPRPGRCPRLEHKRGIYFH